MGKFISKKTEAQAGFPFHRREIRLDCLFIQINKFATQTICKNSLSPAGKFATTCYNGGESSEDLY
jgi:hypothetical protein